MAAGKIHNLKVTVDSTDLEFDPVDDLDIFAEDLGDKNDTSDILAVAAGDESDEDAVTFRVTMDEKKTQQILKDAKEKQVGKPVSLELGTFNPSAPENAELRVARAKRFGIEGTSDDVTVPEETMERMYDSLGIDTKSELLKDRYRLNCIHLKGTDNMSTYDVRRYFASYNPEGIEWIDDSSCNVRWQSESQAIRAVLGVSRPVKRVKPETPPEEGEVSDEDDVAAVEEHVSPMNKTNPESKESSPLPELMEDESNGNNDKEEGEIDEKNEGQTEKQVDLFDVPDDPFEPVDVDITKHTVPPGKWRVCVNPCAQSDLLLLRIASVRDVKEEGAQFKSRYYRDHGNPNLDGMTGLISAGLRKRLGVRGDLRNKLNPDGSSTFDSDGQGYKWMNRSKVRPGLNVYDSDGRELDWDYEHDTRFYNRNRESASRKRVSLPESNPSDSSDSAVSEPKSKRPLMMMRADVEQMNVKRKRRVAKRSSKPTPRWSEEEKSGSESPTPQPWDPPSDVKKMKVTVVNKERRKKRRRHRRDSDVSMSSGSES